MRVMICYDVAHDRRRAAIATELLNFGQRIQESVFLADLDDELRNRMLESLRRLVAEDEDRVHVFEICGACERRVEVLGLAEVPEDRDYYVV